MVAFRGRRVVLVEDQLMFRDVVRMVCATAFGLAIVGEAGDGVESIPLILESRPDIVILDLSLPGADGFEVADCVLRAMPALRILALSSYCDPYTMLRVEKSRIHGFVDKNTNCISVLEHALKAICDGGSYFSPVFHAARTARLKNPQSFEKLLSGTEQVILAKIGRGLDDYEISAELNISRLTAQTHRRNVMHKLNIHGTPKLIAFAAKLGLTKLSNARPRSLRPPRERD